MIIKRVTLPALLALVIAIVSPGVKAYGQTVVDADIVQPVSSSSLILGFDNNNINSPLGVGSYVMGHRNNVLGSHVTVIGYQNKFLGAEGASVFGKDNYATQNFSITLGYENYNVAARSSSMGYKNFIYGGLYTAAVGHYNKVWNSYGTAFGSKNRAWNAYSAAFGYNNSAHGFSAAFGLSNTVATNGGVAFGISNYTKGTNGVAFGFENTIYGGGSVAVGYQNDVNANNAMAVGMNVSNYTSNSLMIGANNTAKITILSNGNVGIGTTNPQSMLAVKGTIRAQKIKVTVTSSEWPDYVFDSSYRLKSLSQLEQFVRQKKHLPEVPSSEEVSVKGVDVGTTQTLLLKKIEELTLYIIQLNKDILHQAEEIKQLKSQINK